MVFDRSVRSVAHLLSAVDARYVEVYTDLLADPFGPAVDPSAVMDLAAEILQADPFVDAIRVLDDLGLYGAHRHEDVLHLPGPCQNPVLRSLNAVGYAEEAGAVGAWSGDDANWALVLWRPPDLVVFAHHQSDLWTHYALTGSYTPRACAFDGVIDSRFRIGGLSTPGAPRTPQVEKILAQFGLTTPDPPSCT
jgi:hypothetical protein